MIVVLGFLGSLWLAFWSARHEEQPVKPLPKPPVIDARTIAAEELFEQEGYSGEYVETMDEITGKKL